MFENVQHYRKIMVKKKTEKEKNVIKILFISDTSMMFQTRDHLSSTSQQQQQQTCKRMR